MSNMKCAIEGCDSRCVPRARRSSAPRSFVLGVVHEPAVRGELRTLSHRRIEDRKPDELRHRCARSIRILGGNGVVDMPMIRARIALERRVALLELGECV